MIRHFSTPEKRKEQRKWFWSFLGKNEINENQRDDIEVKNKSTDMLQIPKAVVQTLEQGPQGMGSIYFSLENQISLVQASQTPDQTIQMHSKEGLC